MINRITSDIITSLEPGQVFVFGSNTAGIHGGGAARTALQWGAVYGKGIGLHGMTYAIPTKNAQITHTLSLSTIKSHVDTFLMFAWKRPDLTFLVTEIGCGLAGLQHADVAPMFKSAIHLENVHLPQKFLDVIK